MSGIETLNLFFRFATIGLQIVLFVQLARDVKLYPFKGLFLGLIACSAVYIVVSSGTAYQLSPELVLSVVPATFVVPWLFWTSTLALFEDDFVLEPFHWIVLALFFTLSCVVFYFSIRVSGSPAGWMSPLRDLAGLALVGHGLFVAWRGRDADLMEKRRSFRLLFVALVGSLIGIIILSELVLELLGFDDGSEALRLAASISIWAIVTFLGLQLLSLRQDSLLVALANTSKPEETPSIDPADQALFQKLQRAMGDDEVFRTEGLTIGILAQKLSTPEHQLRKLINQGLGYKNFNAFLNQYRIAAAKGQLADPEHARKQVLTIALEAGYASLGPFNRAFKEATGQTPSAYRKRALAESAAVQRTKEPS